MEIDNRFNELEKYVDDLVELGLLKKDNNKIEATDLFIRLLDKLEIDQNDGIFAVVRLWKEILGEEND